MVDCIDIKETLITVPKGSCCSISIPIQYITDHDVVIKRGTITGQLFTVQSVITLPYQADRSENLNLFQASKVATEEAEVLNMNADNQEKESALVTAGRQKLISVLQGYLMIR